jgi:hypothetical protein
VEQELLTLLKHLGGVRITRSLILKVCFVDRCLSFCTFSFGHCVVCPSFFDLRILITLLVSSNSSLIELTFYSTVSFMSHLKQNANQLLTHFRLSLILKELFPFNVDKMVPFVQNLMQITFPTSNMLTNNLSYF